MARANESDTEVLVPQNDKERTYGGITPSFVQEAKLTPDQERLVQTTWFTRDRACAHMKVSKKKLAYLIETQQIPPGKVVRLKGALYFEPEHLDHISGAGGSEDIDVNDPTFLKGLAEVLRANIGGLAQYQAHVESFVKKLLEGGDTQARFLKEMLQDQREDNGRLRTRIETLEAKLSEQWQAFEDASSRQNERDLKLLAEQEKQKRISELFTLGKEYAPRLFEQIVGIRRVKKLVAGLSDKNIEQMVDLKIIDESMATIAKEIRADEHARTERAATLLGIKKNSEKPSPSTDAGVGASSPDAPAPAEGEEKKGAAE